MKEILSSIENPNFNSFRDISQYKGPIPKNFCRKGKEIGRKNLTSIEQQQMKIINDCLYKHQESLGIIEKKTISLDDVIFVDTVDVDGSLKASMMTMGGSGGFLTILKKIFYDRKSKGYFEDNIHEGVHYIGLKDGTLKSGFSTVSQEKKTNNGEIYREKYFEFIDEGIVTKIAREIVKNNPEGQKFFDKYYPHKENIEYNSEEEFQKVKDGILADNPNLKRKMEEAYKANNLSGAFKILFSVMEHPLMKELVNKATKENPYEKNVEFVDMIIEILALSDHKNNPKKSLADCKRDVWIDMQKAYFNGNIYRFRNFQKLIGDIKKKNIIRLFARLKTEEVEGNSRRYQIITKVMNEIKESLGKSESEK